MPSPGKDELILTSKVTFIGSCAECSPKNMIYETMWWLVQGKQDMDVFVMTNSNIFIKKEEKKKKISFDRNK